MKLLSILLLTAAASTSYANDRVHDSHLRLDRGDRGNDHRSDRSNRSRIKEEVIDRETLKISAELDVNIRKGESIGVKKELELENGQYVKAIVVRAYSERGNGRLELTVGGRVIDVVNVPYKSGRIRIPVQMRLERGMPVKLVARGNITIETLIAKVKIERRTIPDRPDPRPQPQPQTFWVELSSLPFADGQGQIANTSHWESRRGRLGHNWPMCARQAPMEAACKAAGYNKYVGYQKSTRSSGACASKNASSDTGWRRWEQAEHTTKIKCAY